MTAPHDSAVDIERRFPSGPKPKPIVSYTVQWIAAVAVAILLALVGAIQLVGPTDLGLSPVAFRWVGVVSAGLGVAAGFLPKLQSPPDGRKD